MRSHKLFSRLGILNCTARHVKIVDDFLESGETDVEKLLDKLGSWETLDKKIAESWLSQVNTL